LDPEPINLPMKKKFHKSSILETFKKMCKTPSSGKSGHEINESGTSIA
jgi:hypothetical protein